MGITLVDVGIGMDCDDETDDPHYTLFRGRQSSALHVPYVLGNLNATTEAKLKTWCDTTDTASSQTNRGAWEDELDTQFGSGATSWYNDLSDAEQQRLTAMLRDDRVPRTPEYESQGWLTVALALAKLGDRQAAFDDAASHLSDSEREYLADLTSPQQPPTP